MDDVPVLEQVARVPNNRLWMSLKHPYDNAFKDFDPSVVPLIYRELKDRFVLGPSEVNLSKDQIVSLVSVQCHVRRGYNPSQTNTHSVEIKEATPSWYQSNLNEEFINICQERIKIFTTFNTLDGMKCFLNMVRNYLPHWTEFRNEAASSGLKIPISIRLDATGIYLRTRDMGNTYDNISNEFNVFGSPHIFIPYRLIEGWQMSYYDESSTPSIQQGKRSASPNMPNWSFLSINMPKIHAIPRNSNLEADLPAPGKRKQFHFPLIVKLTEKHINPIELLLISNLANDYRIADMLDFQMKRLKLRDSLEPFSIDDIERFPYASFNCTAMKTYVSNIPEELSFQEKDIIDVKKVSGSRLYGRCRGFEGAFSPENVIFNGMSSELRKVYPEVGVKTNHGEIVIFHMLDETRKSLMVHPCHTPDQITKILVEKLEIPQYHEFFSIFELKSNNDERELWSELPLLSQGVQMSSKLLFKLKHLYHDVAEITEASLISLYYVQIKNTIMNGGLAISESEVIDFASMQVQATWGDYDSEKYKNGFFGTINSVLPLPFQKMSLSRNESWWQKKISAAHQQHKGLNRHEAEKAYIAMSQKLPMSGYRIFKQFAVEDNILAVSRDYVLILDDSMNIVEKIAIDFENFSFINESLIGKIRFVNEHTKREVTYNMASPQILDLLNMFHFLYVIDAKNKLKKRCRHLRESLNVLHIDINSTETFNYTDPELFVRGMINGVALKLLSQILKQLIGATKAFASSSEINIQDTIKSCSDMVTETLEKHNFFQRLDRQHVEDNILTFFKFCHTDLTPSLPKDALSSTDLLDLEERFDIKLAEKVLGALEAILLKNATVLVQLDAIKEYNRISKKTKNVPLMSTGPSSGIQTGTNSSQMTTEDFMRKVVDELLQTEIAYSKDLDKICMNYVKPLSERLSLYETDLERASCIETELLTIFANIEEIAIFHRTFCAQLEQLCKTPDSIDHLAREFIEKIDIFKRIYTIYCSNHVDPTERLPDLKTSPPEVLTIMGMAETSSASAQGIYNDQLARHNLASLLIKPVQRIMRYSLLLKELVKYTPESHLGYNNLEVALLKMKAISADINEVKRKKENERNLQSLHSHLEGFDGSVMAFGELILSGYLVFAEKQISKNGKPPRDTYHCFLFEDIMFLCRDVIGNPSMFSASPAGRKSTGKSASNSFSHSSSGSSANINGYKYKSSVYTRDLKVISSTNSDLSNNVEDMFSWEMLRQDLQKTFIITCRSLEEKDRWIQTIIDCGAKSAVKSAEERPDIETAKKKLHAEVIAINSPSTIQDAKANIFSNTVKKLNSWKRETSPSNVPGNLQLLPQIENNVPRKQKSPARIRSQDSLSSQRHDINSLNEQIEALDGIVRKLIDETQDLNNKINQAKRIAVGGTNFMSKHVQKHKSGPETIGVNTTNAPSQKTLKEQIIARLDEEKNARQELSAHISALEALVEASLSM